ncbi:hypothetical protein SAMN05216266_105283 [Amycolatopsis marina]|uniref:Uncharacterized protein n=1 Tax=Amycolatopsis marina TaxID=490629 RepID=A0A1I0YRC2_9PSEU|nr:hypothetical protein [Amycolatopsis marina]SFB15929.1 hypothetical protein SAMN05216266_105283 [Amycolatopsis marina]
MNSQAQQAEQTLSDIQRIRERSKKLTHGGAWLPALLLGALVLASIALYKYPFAEPVASADGVLRVAELDGWRYPYWMGLPATPHSYLGAYLFWFLGLPLVVILTGAWYRWRGRKLGMTVAWQWYAGITLAVLGLLAIVAAVPSQPVLPTGAPGAPGQAGVLTPLLVVAVAAIALAVVERSRALAFGGAWLGLIAAWHCTMSMGGLPNGQLTLFGLHLPGPVLILAALPLLVFGVLGWWKDRRGAR